MSSVTKFNLLKRFDRLGLLVIVCSSALVLANPLGNDNSGDDQTSSILLGSNESNDLVSRARFANNNHFSPLRWSQLLPTDDFLNSLRERIILVRPISRFPFTRKRSCQFNAGMSHNCDFKDLISASSARRLWGSSNMPGKKRSIVSNAMNPLDDDLSSLNRNGNKVTNNDDDGITSQLQHGSVQYDDESANIEYGSNQ
ncbi:hypothetical protein BLOT_009093 [Blomia tropicalis]|nr:hypothetical protein BLOT_009093 [Blomia tropicalis]